MLVMMRHHKPPHATTKIRVERPLYYYWPLLSFCFSFLLCRWCSSFQQTGICKINFICNKNSKRGTKLFSDYLMGCRVISWVDGWGMNHFSNYKVASNPPLHILNDRSLRCIFSGTCWGFEKDGEWATSDGAQAWMDQDWGGGYYWSNMKYFRR
jgi:hypothetical protein